MKSKIYEFDPVIYSIPIHVTKDFDKDELRSIYNGFDTDDNICPLGIDIPLSTIARAQKVVDSSNTYLYYLVRIFHPSEIGVGLCAHEAFHIANAYLQDLGFSAPSAWDDEQYAYFLQWVTNCIWSVLNDEPDKMKGKLYEVEKG